MSLRSKWLWFTFIILFFYGCGRTLDVNDPNNNLPPAMPQNVGVTWAQDGSVEIAWDYSADLSLKGYNVYRSVNDTLHLKLRAFTNDSFFLDDSLSYDTTYYYRIASVNINNAESIKSDWIKAKPVNQSPPYTPRFLDINARNWGDSTSVYISWQPNNEGDIKGYEVYRSESPTFNADNNTLVGFTPTYYFVDRKNIQLYKTYFYVVKAVDKGGLKSTPSQAISDQVFGKALAILPVNGSTVNYFTSFKIRALSQPARYRIILQTNQYFGEVWSADVSTDVVNDTVSIGFNYPGLAAGSTYYWRIITYSRDTEEPNSISDLYNFTLKP